MRFWRKVFPWVDEKPLVDPSGLHEAQKARENSILGLQAVQKQGEEVRAVAQSLRMKRIRNHWTEDLERSMGAKR